MVRKAVLKLWMKHGWCGSDKYLVPCLHLYDKMTCIVHHVTLGKVLSQTLRYVYVSGL